MRVFAFSALAHFVSDAYANTFASGYATFNG